MKKKVLLEGKDLIIPSFVLTFDFQVNKHLPYNEQFKISFNRNI